MIRINSLIIIDMQEDYIGSSRNKKTYPYNAELLISNINMKIEQYRRNGDMIIYIQNVVKDKKSEFVRGIHIISEFAFEKYKASCFTNYELRAFLTENDITNIELVGVDGNYCVGMKVQNSVLTLKLVLSV